MVEVTFVDNDSETYETKVSIYSPWKYLYNEQAYLIPSIEGDVVIPAGFIKRLKHIEVDND